MVKRLAGREQIAETSNSDDRCRSGDYRSSLHLLFPRDQSRFCKVRTAVFDIASVRQFLSYLRSFASMPHSMWHSLCLSTPPRLPGVAELRAAQYWRPTDGPRIVCRSCVTRSQILHRILFSLSIRQHSESDRPEKKLRFHQ
jgi:hypothetical protein